MQPRGWHKWLSLAQWWYNSNHHRSINMTPFEVLYGYKPKILPTIGELTSVAIVDAYLQCRQHTLQILKTELANAQNRMKQLVDKKMSEREFEEGE